MNRVHYAIVVSEFNASIIRPLLEGALERFDERGISLAQIKVVKVPGAIEIPLVAQGLARQKRYAALIALGAVIRGETSHYDYVCEQVSAGCQRVMLDHHLPVVFGVLTTDNEEQAKERIGGIHGHKGKEAVDVALRMVELMALLLE